mgnify:CR=1 FL=1
MTKEEGESSTKTNISFTSVILNVGDEYDIGDDSRRPCCVEGGRIDPRVECDTNVSRSELGLNGNLMVLTLYGYDGYLVGTSDVVELVLNYQEATTVKAEARDEF